MSGDYPLSRIDGARCVDRLAGAWPAVCSRQPGVLRSRPRTHYRVLMVTSDEGSQGRIAGVFSTLGALAADTVRLSLRYRVTALAAEVAFFALLALPPLVLALAASAAWIGSVAGLSNLTLEFALRDYLSPFLTEEVVRKIIIPTLNDALNRPRYDVISFGFLLSLWSGSRALHVYVEVISIMFGLSGGRGLVRGRLLSFGIYLVALVLLSLTLPLLLAGPGVLADLLPAQLGWLLLFYWPAVGVLSVVTIAFLFHLSTPVPLSFRRSLPGAALGVLIWVGASAVMRFALAVSLSPAATSTSAMSIYGPLTTPIVLLMWLYLLAIAVLIGAALNAAIEQRWPDGERSARRAKLAEKLASQWTDARSDG